MEENQRTEMLIGNDAIEKLKKSSIIIFGIGGVGSFTAEALARAGIGNITLVDNDTVALSNINRQLVALHSTVGRFKTEVMKERIYDINPQINVTEIREFYLPSNRELFEIEKYDYIIDCIDTITAKLDIIERAYKSNTNIICSMGTGNKLHAEKFEITDIKKTSVCPLARTIRHECSVRGIKKLKVLYSMEQPILNVKTRTPGSISFVPSVAGLLIAGEVVRDILSI